MYESYNAKKVVVELERIDLCDLLHACLVCSDFSDNVKFEELACKLSDILDNFDKDNFDAYCKEFHLD